MRSPLCLVLVWLTAALTLLPPPAGAGAVAAASEDDVESRVSSVSAAARTITVRGVVPPDSGQLELHELAAHETADAAQHRAPLVTASPGRDGTFAMTVDRFDGQRDRYYSKFLVVDAGGDAPRPVDDPAYVTTIDFPATHDFPYPEPPSKKGLQVQMVDDAEELGISHAGINLALDQYLYEHHTNPDDTIVFESGGREYYFRRGAVEGLDRRIKSLSDNGVLVNLILILYDRQRANSPNDVLLHPDAARGQGTVYAFNTADEVGTRYFTAAMEFFTSRYTRPDERYGRAVGFIVGNEVDAQWIWQNMGEKPVRAFMEEYARTVRLVWLAARKAYTHPRVYISLTHFWNRPFAEQPLRYYAGRDVVDLMDEISERGGDFPWHLAQHPYPEDLFDPAFWEDTTAWDTPDTPRITFKNLEVLTRYFGRDELAFEGERRRIILSEQGFHTPSYAARHQRLQAAAYALAYYKVRFLDGIDSFILHRHVDHKLEGGLRLGLWTWDEERRHPAAPGRKKAVYDVFRDIDTARSLEVTEFAKQVIGIDDWSELVPGFDPALLAQREPPRLVGTRIVRDTIGPVTVADFEDGEEGWQPAENVHRVEAVDGALKLHFSTFAKLWRGADVTLDEPIDARSHPWLTVSLQLPDADPGDPYEAKVKVYADGRVAEGVAQLTPEDGTDRLAVDLRGWDGLDAVDRIKVWARESTNDDWAGSYLIDQVALARRVVPEGGHANFRVVPSATHLEAGQSLSVAVTNLDVDALHDEIVLDETDSLAVSPTTLDVEGLATGERRTYQVRIERAAGDEARLRYTYRARTFERPVRLLHDPTGERDLPDHVTALYNFEGTVQGWRAGANVSRVSSADSFLNAPRRPRLGEYVLAADSDNVAADAWRTVYVEPPNGIDLSDADPFFIHINGYGGVPDATYEARVRMTSAAGDVLTRTVPISADAWNRVEIPVSEWAGAAHITRIEVSYRAVGNDMTWPPQFQVDFVGYESRNASGGR
jgi:hypothetical protein